MQEVSWEEGFFVLGVSDSAFQQFFLYWANDQLLATAPSIPLHNCSHLCCYELLLLNDESVAVGTLDVCIYVIPKILAGFFSEEIQQQFYVTQVNNI